MKGKDRKGTNKTQDRSTAEKENRLFYKAVFFSVLQILSASAVTSSNIFYGKGRIKDLHFVIGSIVVGFITQLIYLEVSWCKLETNKDALYAIDRLSQNNQNSQNLVKSLKRSFCLEVFSRFLAVCTSVAAPFFYKRGKFNVYVYFGLLFFVAVLNSVSSYNNIKAGDLLSNSGNKLNSLLNKTNTDDAIKRDADKNFSTDEARVILRVVVQSLLRMSLTTISFLYSRYSLTHTQFAIASLCVHCALLFLIIGRIKCSAQSNKTLSHVLKALEPRKHDQNLTDDIKNKEDRFHNNINATIALELFWIFSSVSTPYLYRTGYINEPTYYLLLVCVALFGLFSYVPSTHQRLENKENTEAILSLLQDSDFSVEGIKSGQQKTPD